MKWRCTWCGKPHESNDPPCDSCGHSEFEKAIVRETEFETVDTGTQYMWVCSDCGRQHMRNNPPCSRCGSHDLEKTEQTAADDALERDLDVPGWLEVARPYLPILVVFALIVALFATGVIPPSIIPGIGAPSPPEAPGEGAEVAGIDLEAAEDEVHERLEDARDSDESRTHDDGLAAYAEYLNRGAVAMEHDDASPDSVSADDFDAACGDATAVNGRIPLSIDDYDGEAELAADVADSLRSEDPATDAEFEAEGVDLHYVDELLYVTYAAC